MNIAIAKWYFRAKQHIITASANNCIKANTTLTETDEKPLMCNNENIAEVKIINAISFFFIKNSSTNNNAATHKLINILFPKAHNLPS